MSVLTPYHLTMLPDLIAQRVGTEQKPSILSVVATQPRFGLSRLSGSQNRLPRGSQPVQFFGMDRRRPAPTLCLLGREAHVVEIVLVEEFGGAVRKSRPRQHRDRVDDELEIALSCPERFFSALSLVDVDEQVVPTDDTPIGILERKATRLKPAIGAIETSTADFELKGLAGRHRSGEDLDGKWKILGMNSVAGRPALKLILRRTEILEYLPVDEFLLTARHMDRDHARNTVDDQPGLLLAFAQGFLSPLPIFDVDQQVEPAEDVALRIAQRQAMTLYQRYTPSARRWRLSTLYEWPCWCASS